MKRTKIVRGSDNEVYDVATREGSAFIVKIKQYGEMSFEQEQWAMDRCWEVGIPVPRTYAIGSVQRAEKEREYLIQEKASGQPLAVSIDTLSRSQITQVFHQAGELLRRIHQVKVEGFYRLQQDSTWDFPSWKRLGDANVRERAQEIAWIRQAGFSHGEVETMLHDLERYREEFTCEQPVLCHGDDVPEHIFLDEELHISALLDFGMFLGHHPIHDFALYNPAPPALRLHALKAGYGDYEMFRDRLQERLLLHRLGLQMGELAYHAREGMQPEAERLSRR